MGHCLSHIEHLRLNCVLDNLAALRTSSSLLTFPIFLARFFLLGLICLQLISCGAGSNTQSSDVPSVSVNTNLTIQGTAAVGLALGGANVTAKCASGSGIGNALPNGQFSIVVPEGVLPCLLQTTNPADGSKLHSMAIGTTLSANANVTLFSEMLVARILLNSPKVFFATFNPLTAKEKLTKKNVNSAKNDVDRALGGIIDTTSIADFLSDRLIAATKSGESSGDNQDHLLDILYQKLGFTQIEALTTFLANGSDSSSIRDQVMSMAALQATPPRSNAGPDQNVIAGTNVLLNANQSNAVLDRPLKYTWALVSKPAGSQASLTANASVTSGFFADKVGSYVATLVVNDGKFDSSVSVVSIVANPPNAPPIANAGVSRAVLGGTLVSLDGSSSSDANGDVLSFAWTLSSKPAGSNAKLEKTNTANPVFTPEVVGIYIASLVVSDGKLSSVTSSVQINVDSVPVGAMSGYMDKHSYVPGEAARIYIHTAKKGNQHIRLLDVNGKEVYAFDAVVGPQPALGNQPWRDGYGYSEFATVIVPSIASGVYFWEGSVRMIVRALPNANPDILVVYPSNTENAYNAAGGKSFYTPAEPNHAPILSFKRPVAANNATYMTAAGFYKWLADSKYKNVGHVSDFDLESYINIASTKLVVLVGHSEYWTRQARENFDRFVDTGGSALILSGNTMWWQVRYSETSGELICYKSATDPVVDQKFRTTIFNALKSSPYPTVQSIGADFDRGGYGLKQDDGWNGFKVTNAQSPVFAGTGLRNGDVIYMPGGEYDGAPLSGYDVNGVPIIDTKKLGFDRIDLLGYDFGFRSVKTVATWIIFKKTTTSGMVINGASLGWGDEANTKGQSGESIKKIYGNMIDILLSGIYPEL